MEMYALHWLPEHDRWEKISWEDWSAFRGIMAPGVPLAALSGGVHHFVVVVVDDGALVNIIPHKYMIETDGSIGHDNFGGLTKEERSDYSRIMVAADLKPNDEDRLRQIQDKWGEQIGPPKESIGPLKWAFDTAPKAGSAAERFFAHYR